MERSQHKYETRYEKGKPYWSEYDHKRMVSTRIMFYVDGILKDSYEEVREANYKLVWSDRLLTNVKEYLE